MTAVDKWSADDLPELPGLISVAVAARRHGVHKGTIYYLLQKQQFKQAFKINTSADEDNPRPVLVLTESEVAQVFATRAMDRKRAALRPPTAKQQLREWTIRVKQWGRDTGWAQRNEPIFATGPALAALIDDYLAANPNDPRPE